MSDAQTYYEQRLPDLIKRMKSQVQKNFDIIDREVESDLGSDKYLNVLKGRRIAAENSLDTMKQIDKLEKKLKLDGVGYYKEQLPLLIERLKAMIDINLNVVDIEIDDDTFEDDNLKESIGDDIEEIFGKDIAKKLFKKMAPNDKLSEDKFHQVLKARKAAAEDTEWALNTIDDLERQLQDKEEKGKKKSWAKVAAGV